ncbi:MAG: hypothetical protein DMD44_07470 [Gemmatimonadetes bacterium]|nr:MAG: hypothetical protein DMD44_07470 [Gemmatimonadota bacterium]
MPDAATRRREVHISEVRHALAAARCAARLAGLGTRELVVRELLLTMIDQTDRAERGVARLLSTPSRDACARRLRL